MKTRLRPLACVAFLATSACSPDFGAVHLEALSTPPVHVSIHGTRVELPAGVAVVVRAELESDNAKPYDESNRLDLLSADRVVFTTYPRAEANEFVLVGVNEGETCIDVVVDGRREGCVPVTVTAPAL